MVQRFEGVGMVELVARTELVERALCDAYQFAQQGPVAGLHHRRPISLSDMSCG